MNVLKSLVAWAYLIVLVLLRLVLPLAAIGIYAYLAIGEGHWILASFIIVMLALLVALIIKTCIEVSVEGSRKHRHSSVGGFKKTGSLQYQPAQNRRGIQR